MAEDYATFAAGWYAGASIETKSHALEYNEAKHCGANIELGRHKPRRRHRTRIYTAEACGSTLEYKPTVRGNPCPNAPVQIHAKDTGGQTGFTCLYPKPSITSDFIKDMSKNTIATTAGTDEKSVYHQLLVGHQKPNALNISSVGKGFCEDAKNLNTEVADDGTTCYRYLSTKVNEATAKLKAADYCKSTPSAIKTELCMQENIGKDEHSRLAGVYCEGEGKNDEWCSCYNAFKGKCLTNPGDYAGCNTVKSAHDSLLADIPADQVTGTVRQQFEERMHCRANICKTTDAFKPDGSDECSMNLQLCIQDVKVAGHMVDSGITITCNNEQKTGGGDAPVEGEEDDGGGEPQKDTTRDTLMGIDKKTAKIGIGVTGSLSMSMCMCLLLVIVMVEK